MVGKVSRVSQVVKVAYNYGLGRFLRRCGLNMYIPWSKCLIKKTGHIETSVREALEELGGAYVKLGQLLSLRPDLVPPNFSNEFKKLQDQVKPFPEEEARRIIKEELGKPVEQIFSHFDPRPLGSASIGQVYFARLKNGKKVVIKVIRPGIEELFNADIQVMKFVAERLSKRFPYLNLKEIVQEFERYTKKELNFQNEARNIKKFHENLKKSKIVKVPEVYEKLSTKKVLVMSYLQGRKLSEVDHKEINPKIVAKNIIDTLLHQIFETNAFHADLHPGNILVLPNNHIGLLDFGIVGGLDKQLKKRTTEMLIALVEKDIDGIVKTLMRTGIVTKEFHKDEFREEVKELVDDWWGSSLKDAKLTHLLHVLFSASTKNGLKIPVDMFLIAKALMAMEGTCVGLYPDFNFVDYSKPYIDDLIKKQYRKKLSFTHIMRKVKRAEIFSEELIEGTKDIMDKLKEGVIEININDSDIKHVGEDMNRSSNRLSYALIISAFIVTSAMLVDFGPSIKGYPIFTSVAIIVAVIMAIPLLGSILREGHDKYDPHGGK